MVQPGVFYGTIAEIFGRVYSFILDTIRERVACGNRSRVLDAF